jgi:hypothetical protein
MINLLVDLLIAAISEPRVLPGEFRYAAQLQPSSVNRNKLAKNDHVSSHYKNGSV